MNYPGSFYWVIIYIPEIFLSKIDKLVVTTDSSDIKNVASKYSNVLVHNRSELNSNDIASTDSVILEVIKDLGMNWDESTTHIGIYQATSPFVEVSTINKCFEESEKGKFDALFDKCKATNNVNFRGYGLNQQIRDALQDTHIYVYPSIFEETSCLAIIEAMSAGCHVVTTNYGALPETCGEFATMIEFDSGVNNLIERYADTLNSVIDNYKNNIYKEDLEMQIKYYEKYYSWNTRITEWNNFLNYARKEKTS